MRILAVSDEVVNVFYKQDIKNLVGHIDLLLACGDLPYTYLEYLVSVFNLTYAGYVHGNHDAPEYLHNGEELTEPGGLVNLDGQTEMLNGVLVAGLEGSIRYRPNAPYQYTQKEIYLRMQRLIPKLLLNRVRYGRYLDIFIAHSPPAGVHDGPDRPHQGFQAFLSLMQRFRPRLLLHGHKHYYPPGPWKTAYKDTEVVNVHPFRLIDITEDKINYGRFYRR
ncbi:MAG: metallophosphoesterase [Anaerolineae bacterium]|nr:metallophosphoesterase [Anaerolineae bacterium]